MHIFYKYKYIIILLLNVLIIRSFILEPFRIPSGSMIPTLLIGDFIFVNKFIYGIKIPLTNKKIININTPERGDIIVFKHISGQNYIKRVIGLEGDVVVYENKKFIVNGKIVKNQKKSNDIEFENNDVILQSINKKEFISPKKEFKIKQYKNIENEYKYINITVPKSSYFVIGDNRDNSEDSRTWGFVQEKNIIGKAIITWLSIDMVNKIIRTERIIKKIK